jgi:hypothetical protein
VAGHVRPRIRLGNRPTPANGCPQRIADRRSVGHGTSGVVIKSRRCGGPLQLGRPEQSTGHFLARQHPPAAWSPESEAIGSSCQETPGLT